jgi:SAM-dependent methyltransferase
MAPQPRFVDLVLNAENLTAHFGLAAFDVVICTEMMEHVENWKSVSDELKNVLAPGGLLIVTTRSEGFPVHGYPSDHWRYTTEDLGAMFGEFRPIYLGDDPDPLSPGVFFAGVKPPEAPLKLANPTTVEVPYHCDLAFHERLRLRQTDPKEVSPLRTFYHVACMGSWRQVFRDQVAILGDLGLQPECHVLGTSEDFAEVVAQFPDAVHHGQNFTLYETPTLEAAHRWAIENPTGAVLYLHTKGVSQPQDEGKQAWRILMEEALLRDWVGALRSLSHYDMVGLNWMANQDFPHYCGNFWMARNDWLASLPSPQDYRAAGGPWIAGNPWERMHAEMWLGSRPWHHMRSLRFQGERLWERDRATELLDPVGKERFEKFIRS